MLQYTFIMSNLKSTFAIIFQLVLKTTTYEVANTYEVEINL